MRVSAVMVFTAASVCTSVVVFVSRRSARRSLTELLATAPAAALATATRTDGNSSTSTTDIVKLPSFSVAQFNLLASYLALPRHFPYVMPTWLEWNARKWILLDEIRRLDADVLCLQELDRYWTFFKPHLEALGYNSVYIPRVSVKPNRPKYDGCGIFMRDSVFKLVWTRSIQFADGYDRVGLCTVAELNDSLLPSMEGYTIPKHVMFVTTHLYWNWKATATQVRQLEELKEAVIDWTCEFAAEHDIDALDIPLVFTGDFNNSPTSMVFKYVRESFRRYNNDEMVSVFGDELPFTSCNFKRRWVIDYIFHSTGLRVLNRSQVPSLEELQKDDGPEGWLQGENTARLVRRQPPLPLDVNHNGIPNSRHGSDHLPIVAKFEVQPIPDSDRVPRPSLDDVLAAKGHGDMERVWSADSMTVTSVGRESVASGRRRFDRPIRKISTSSAAVSAAPDVARMPILGGGHGGSNRSWSPRPMEAAGGGGRGSGRASTSPPSKSSPASLARSTDHSSPTKSV